MLTELGRGLTGGLFVLSSFWAASCLVASERSTAEADRSAAWRWCVSCAAAAAASGLLFAWLQRRPTGVPVLDARRDAYRASPSGEPWVVSDSVVPLRRR